MGAKFVDNPRWYTEESYHFIRWNTTPINMDWVRWGPEAEIAFYDIYSIWNRSEPVMEVLHGHDARARCPMSAVVGEPWIPLHCPLAAVRWASSHVLNSNGSEGILFYTVRMKWGLCFLLCRSSFRPINRLTRTTLNQPGLWSETSY